MNADDSVAVVADSSFRFVANQLVAMTASSNPVVFVVALRGMNSAAAVVVAWDDS